MDFELSEEKRLLVKAVTRFATEEIAPLAERIDEDGNLLRTLWPRLGAMGFLGLAIPEEYGGSGGDMLDAALVIEHLARASGSLALSYGAHLNLCAHNILRNGNEEQRKRYLPGLSDGSLVGGLAITEPMAGSDAVGLKTAAVRDGDHYVLNGTKTFITNAPIADVILLYAKTDPAAGARGITAFLVDTDLPGFSVSKRLEKMGHKGSPTGEISLTDCRVPVSRVVGRENGGISVMMSGLDMERAFLAAGALGLAEEAMQLAIRYARERVQFGKPIGAFQLTKAKIADMYTRIEASRLLCYRAVLAAERADRGGRGTEIHRLAAAAILMAGEVSEEVSNEALQIHGGYGYTTEYPINRIFRDARLYTIGAGTSEIRRLIIGEELLGIR